MMHPKRQMLVGGITLFAGWFLLLAMVIEMIPNIVWLSVVSYALSLIGFMIGILGVVSLIQIRKRNDRD